MTKINGPTLILKLFKDTNFNIISNQIYYLVVIVRFDALTMSSNGDETINLSYPIRKVGPFPSASSWSPLNQSMVFLLITLYRKTAGLIMNNYLLTISHKWSSWHSINACSLISLHTSLLKNIKIKGIQYLVFKLWTWGFADWIIGHAVIIRTSYENLVCVYVVMLLSEQW